MKKILLVIASLAAFATAEVTLAQGSNARDDMEVLISQIQTDKRAVVLSTLRLSDAEVAAFTPIYDRYQADMKKQVERGVEVINKFAANHGSMTEDAAEDILKEWLKLRDERNSIARKYAKEMGRALPATRVLQWVQVESKLNALLDVEAARIIPVSR